ncbi:DUF2069 domain-containing protein [Kingella negevensis]|uniref:DUF2069 domain-containing protein n=1 Tax=Kingella negevensis TaxID=1522312 RepID=A0A238HGS2_9NEIS|nr:DUF2069 domain-containing protein [Kingella negevensis]MDK4681195.1 DUF2069 domain-containing protein [Kingella negevensis]MDK4683392.1 DUF2069 domain-containing protein [Kingella negevensis]MDK4685064.1 DUF2069 domain-containing protein [Kingella negevensis]MDK4689537.1 DUF2069 domain-containing protein [Kingella negevensis]MDK4691473.1 DUF2069 domain-containing protein [Kingella negevensis]
MSQNHHLLFFNVARVAWLLLIGLTLLWDAFFNPLHTGRVLLLLKLLPLLLPLRGILSGKIYTYQYCSMLVMMYFIEGVMRLWDVQAVSRVCAAAEVLLSVIFFIGCLKYLQHFKIKKAKS